MFHKKENKEPFKGTQPDMAPKQMEQIQQHEWKDRLIRGPYTLQECSHCPVLKEKLKGHPTQFFKGKESFKVEPKCITRPANTADNNFRKTTDDTNNRNKGG